MDRDDPEKHGADLAVPTQTPNYQQRELNKKYRIIAMGFAMVGALVVGAFVLDYGLDREDGAAPEFVWLGVAVIVLTLLVPVALSIKVFAGIKQENPLREPGTIQLLTVASTYRLHERIYLWEIMSEMQIRLDSGDTCRGIYLARVNDEPLRQWWWRAFPPGPGRLRRRITPREALDAWFHVGGSVRCLYNPANPDTVVAFPFAVPGDRLTYRAFHPDEAGQVVFESAT